SPPNLTTHPHLMSLFPITPDLPPFIQTFIKVDSCHIMTLGFQLFMRHCFSGGYSLLHRQGADDTTTCSCGHTHTITHILQSCPHTCIQRRELLHDEGTHTLFTTSYRAKKLIAFLTKT